MIRAQQMQVRLLWSLLKFKVLKNISSRLIDVNILASLRKNDFLIIFWSFKSLRLAMEIIVEIDVTTLETTSFVYIQMKLFYALIITAS